ncbi:MotE family protein [Lentibacter sp.]|uniref:MotE family protein n=1 Tax=Lentibacter sp. TaxID=2024994 RepID=UPI003F6A9FF8
MIWTFRRSGRPARGALFTIAILLVGSAVLRIGLSASEAIALETPTSKTDSDVHEASACETTGDLQGMLAAFQSREASIAERETQIKKRMQALAVADEKIEAKLAALTKAEEDLRATLALADSAAEDDLSRLTTVYENMKPKDASALFEQMDPEFSSGFLGRMKPAAAASIMAGLSAERAYSISVILAGRNANVPKQ